MTIRSTQAPMILSNALKWSYLSELASKAIQPLIFVVLARLLSPEDFGVITAAMMVIAFAQIFSETGMAKALIQRQTNTDEAANIAYFANIAIAIIIASTLYLTADLIAEEFFQDPRVAPVLKVMTVQIVLSVMCAVQVALLQKQMHFRKLFWVRIVTVTLPGLASVPLAWAGMGYWALVFGNLAGQLLQVLVLWQASHWRPAWKLNLSVARDMVRFSSWVTASALLSWFYMWADSVIVSIYRGTHDLGIYRTGAQLANLGFNTIFSPMLPVLYSYLSEHAKNRATMAAFIEITLTFIISISVPLGILVYTIREPLGACLFDAKWEGVEAVLGVMALVQATGWISGTNGEVYRALGKPSYETIVFAAFVLIYVIGYIASVKHGLDTFVWTRLGLVIAAMLMHMRILRMILSIEIAKIFRHLLITASISAVVIHETFQIFSSITNNAWQLIAVTLATSVLVFAPSILNDYKLYIQTAEAVSRERTGVKQV